MATETDTVTGVARRSFWVSEENELGTVQASKGSSSLAFGVFGGWNRRKGLGGVAHWGRGVRGVRGAIQSSDFRGARLQE